MKINQAELDDAIETISEGGTALGVSCEDVYRKMMSNDEKLALKLMQSIHWWNRFTDFDTEFAVAAEEMLLEALRAKMENDNGL